MKLFLLVTICFICLSQVGLASEQTAILTKSLNCTSGDRIAKVSKSAISGTETAYFLMIPPDYWEMKSFLTYRPQDGSYYCSRGFVKFDATFDHGFVTYNDGTTATCQ